MSHEIEQLKLCLTTPGTLAPMIVGPPGIGKTQRIKKVAKDLGWECEILSPGERGEGAFGVVPVPNADGFLHYPAPDWVKKFMHDGCKGGLVFVDEFNTAPPALQPPLLGLMLEGRIGGVQLPPHIRRAGAMNPVSQAAAGWDLPPALANRMQYMQWGAPNATEWADWLLSDEPLKMDTPGWTKARAMAAVYHRKHAGQLLEDSEKALSAGRFPPAYATPRSWETAVRMLATCYDRGCEDRYVQLANGILGSPIATEWCTWLRKNDLPDPEDLLADPKSWKPDPREGDKTFATCFSVAEAATQESAGGGKKYSLERRKDRWNAAWKVLDIALPLGKGMVAVAARKLARPECRPEGAIIQPEIKKIITQLKDVIGGAGLM